MKVSVIIVKSEIEAAIKQYILDRLDTTYKYQLRAPTLSFSNKDGEIGFFSCIAETEVELKKEKK